MSSRIEQIKYRGERNIHSIRGKRNIHSIQLKYSAKLDKFPINWGARVFFSLFLTARIKNPEESPFAWDSLRNLLLVGGISFILSKVLPYILLEQSPQIRGISKFIERSLRLEASLNLSSEVLRSEASHSSSCYATISAIKDATTSAIKDATTSAINDATTSAIKDATTADATTSATEDAMNSA